MRDGDKAMMGDAVRVTWAGVGMVVALERSRRVRSEQRLRK